jgi:hypothetical protein
MNTIESPTGSQNTPDNKRENTKVSVLGKWWKRIGVVGGLTVLAATAQSINDQVSDLLYEEQIMRDIAANEALMNLRYGFMVGLPISDGKRKPNCNYVDALNMLKWTADVLSRYPDEMIKKRVYEVEIAEKGFYSDSSGENSYHHVIVTLKVNNLPRLIKEEAFKSVLTHELQHSFEEPGENSANRFLAWESLSPKGATYKNTDYSIKDWSLFTDFTKPDGFIFDYQTKSALEDRAVVAQVLFAPSVARSLAVEVDPVMQKKIQALRAFYFDISGGKMNDAYWDDSDNGKVNFFYWTKRQ